MESKNNRDYATIPRYINPNENNVLLSELYGLSKLKNFQSL